VSKNSVYHLVYKKNGTKRDKNYSRLFFKFVTGKIESYIIQSV